MNPRDYVGTEQQIKYVFKLFCTSVFLEENLYREYTKECIDRLVESQSAKERRLRANLYQVIYTTKLKCPHCKKDTCSRWNSKLKELNLV